jgi:outer membrane protein assembly factor BamB
VTDVIDERDIIERAVRLLQPEEPALSRMLRRRDRRRRSRRIGAALVAIVVFLAAASLLLPVLNRGAAPASQTITPSNVGALSVAWSANLPGHPPELANPFTSAEQLPPSLSNGNVIVAAGTSVVSYSETCIDPCAPTWTGRLPGTAANPPTVTPSGDIVVSTENGKLSAFAAACRPDCSKPTWTADIGHRFGASPVVQDGAVYGLDPYSATLYAVPLRCDQTCHPVWTGTLGPPTAPVSQPGPFGSPGSRSGEWDAPIVSDGVVYALGPVDHAVYAYDASTGKQLWHSEVPMPAYTPRFNIPILSSGSVVDGVGQRLYAFKVGCRSDGGSCPPLWSSSPIDAYLSEPIVEGGQVFVGTASGEGNGSVASFSDCANGTTQCLPSWRVSRLPEMSVAQPTVVGDQLIATSSIGGRVMAFPVACAGDPCPITWKAAVSGAITPVASGDVVFVASPGGTLAAYDVHCATGGATCQPSWTWSDADGESPPALDGSRAFVVTRDWRLVAFGLGSGPRASGAPSPGLPVAAIAVAAIGGTIALVRRRRKKAELFA